LESKYLSNAYGIAGIASRFCYFCWMGCDVIFKYCLL